MSIQSTLQRVDALRQALNDPATLISASTGGTAAPVEVGGAGGSESFAAALRQAGAGVSSSAGGFTPAGVPLPGEFAPGVAPPSGVLGAGALSPTSLASSSPTGARIVAIAESQLGQRAAAGLQRIAGHRHVQERDESVDGFVPLHDACEGHVRMARAAGTQIVPPISAIWSASYVRRRGHLLSRRPLSPRITVSGRSPGVRQSV